MTTLEMLVAQDAAAYDGQISVAANKIVGKCCNKIQLLTKRRLVNDHGRMLGIEHNPKDKVCKMIVKYYFDAAY